MINTAVKDLCRIRRMNGDTGEVFFYRNPLGAEVAAKRRDYEGKESFFL